jgi:tetratricopeptide (TPR) repeat protein
MARRWDAASGAPVSPSLAHPAEVCAVAFSPDGSTVITACADGRARLWDTATGQANGAFRAGNGRFKRVCLGPGGTVALAVATNGGAKLWDVKTGAAIGTVMGPGGYAWDAAFSRDGKTVTTVSYPGLHWWDAANGRLIGQVAKRADFLLSAAFSADGQRFLTGGDETAGRLWDAATSWQLGPALPHQGRLTRAELSPDGRTAVTTSGNNEALLWDLSELPDDLPRIECWVQVRTGLALDEEGRVKNLDEAGWRKQTEHLATLGGAPEGAEPRWRLDPVLFGHDPTARAKAWVERKRWPEAEAAYNEVVAARSLDGTVMLERARFYASRSEPQKAEAAYAEAVGARPFYTSARYALSHFQLARGRPSWAAATLAQGVRLSPDDVALRLALGACLLYSGDRAGWRRASATMLDRFGGARVARTANDVAWACALAPGATADPGVPVRLAEVALRDGPEYFRDIYLNTLGAALYRAGRCDEAIRRLQEGIERRGGASVPDDWPFLAMAHHRLGHQAEARRWLERLRESRPSDNPDRFAEDLTTALLLSEAEAVILYDNGFPDDPFAQRRPGETPREPGADR